MHTKSVIVTGCLALLLIFARARAEDVFRASADLPPLLQFNDGSRVKTGADLERRKPADANVPMDREEAALDEDELTAWTEETFGDNGRFGPIADFYSSQQELMT